MKSDEAVLLPMVRKQFVDEAFANVSMFPNVGSITERDLPTNRWLLSRLHVFFEDNIEVQCRHKRFGTLIFHKNCDMVHALSTVLGQKGKQTDRLADTSAFSRLNNSYTIDQQAQTMALYLNDRLYERGRAFQTIYNDAPEQVASTDLSSVMASTDTVLLQFLMTMTQSVRHSHRKLFEDKPTEAALTTKTIRLLYVLSELQPLKLSIVSVDNINIMQSHGFVSSQNATRSWLGTSVQCVLPLPVSGNLTPDDVLRLKEAGQGRKRLPASPAGIPIATEKQKRRRRTLTEQCPPHTTMIDPSVLQHTQTSNPELFDVVDPPDYITTVRTLSLTDFNLNAIEQSTLDTPQTDLFHSILLCTYNSSHTFPALPSLINCMRKKSADKEVSNVTYIEVVSKKADSKHTLIGVVSRTQQGLYRNWARSTSSS